MSDNQNPLQNLIELMRMFSNQPNQMSVNQSNLVDFILNQNNQQINQQPSNIDASLELGESPINLPTSLNRNQQDQQQEINLNSHPQQLTSTDEIQQSNSLIQTKTLEDKVNQI